MNIFFRFLIIAAISGAVLCAIAVFTSADRIPPISNSKEVDDAPHASEEYLSVYGDICEAFDALDLPRSRNGNAEEIIYLTEYPEELLPYIEELEHINSELGTDFEFAIREAASKEIIDFYTSMDIETFRDFIYGMNDENIRIAEYYKLQRELDEQLYGPFSGERHHLMREES